MKKCLLTLTSFFVILCGAQSQSDTTDVKHKIALFTPLYLDSAFDAVNEYRYAKNVFPKFINPGLEFYEGAQMALDSMNKTGVHLEVFVYDTRSGTEPLDRQIREAIDKGAEALIVHCSNNEVRMFADMAFAHRIPFINTTVPNDAGITGNPYFIILNPTLKTQCEGIYRYMQQHYALTQITVFRRKGSADESIKALFDDYRKATLSIPLRLNYVELNENFVANDLVLHLDSTRVNVLVAGSLDMNFGRQLTQHLASIGKTYPITIIGMPTWDAIRDFTKPEFKGIEIIYSTPFYNPRTDRLSQCIYDSFTTRMYARPSDMVYRGYEVVWKFVHLLQKFGKDFATNSGNKEQNLFTDFDIQPVINQNSLELDYFENKKLYFLKWQDGLIKSVN